MENGWKKDLREIREDRGSMEHAARALNVSTQQVWRWFNEKCSPNPLSVEKIEEVAAEIRAGRRGKKRAGVRA